MQVEVTAEAVGTLVATERTKEVATLEEATSIKHRVVTGTGGAEVADLAAEEAVVDLAAEEAVVDLAAEEVVVDMAAEEVVAMEAEGVVVDMTVEEVVDMATEGLVDMAAEEVVDMTVEEVVDMTVEEVLFAAEGAITKICYLLEFILAFYKAKKCSCDI